ncbi:MAG: aminotransferase class V-fold PLP-dependent enzyme, partial [Solirubrobacterales bacterium]
MVRQVSFSQTVFASPPLKFEAGTSNVAGAAGLKAAIDYINGLGLNRIATYEKGLLEFALRRLETVDGLRVFGEPQCGLLSFDLAGVHPHDAGDVLDKLGIAVRTGTLCAEPLMRHLGVSGTIRASLAFYNTEEEIERLVAGLKKARELFGNGL